MDCSPFGFWWAKILTEVMFVGGVLAAFGAILGAILLLDRIDRWRRRK